jgi:hypothetical protein
MIESVVPAPLVDRNVSVDDAALPPLSVAMVPADADTTTFDNV